MLSPVDSYFRTPCMIHDYTGSLTLVDHEIMNFEKYPASSERSSNVIQ
jgi:hypothetical protein